ncbi:hypothetical protein HF878_02860 [Selenomonas bovis]|uniref:ADP-ribosylglycohydrolase n=1 Tax=Selenomonas bovis TaxID=416586 RepID=A0A848B8Z5_9FIRM|nr:hypothetical protein [Selenomonas bovis]
MRTAWTPSSIDFTLSRFEWLNYRHKDFTLFHPKCRPTDNTITFFPSTDFEDAIRNAISIGGDSDTIAAIAGSLTEACYGIPEGLREAAVQPSTRHCRSL